MNFWELSRVDFLEIDPLYTKKDRGMYIAPNIIRVNWNSAPTKPHWIAVL